MYFLDRSARLLGVLTLMLSLVSCGGGGGGGSPNTNITSPSPGTTTSPQASLQVTIGATKASPLRAGASVGFYVASVAAAEGPVTTTWFFGDGSSKSNVDIVEHVYSTPGTYTVRLQAVDAAGKSAIQTMTVVVEANTPPDTPSISYFPSDPAPGQSVTLIGSGTDKYGDDLQFSWTMWNGQQLNGVQQSVTFPSAGYFLVQLTVTDSVGATAQVQRTITVGSSSSTPVTPTPTKSWTQNYDWTQGYLYDLSFYNAQTGYVAATTEINGGGTQASLLKTSDAGANWSAIDTGKRSSTIAGVRFVGANEGWIVGSGESRTFRVADGWIIDLNWGMLMHTTDGGSTWSNVSLGTLGIISGILERVTFADSQHGWAVGTEAMIISTTDGGTTWKKQNANVGQENRFSFVQFIDSQRGWVAGSGGQVLRTTDGGNTWTPVRITGLDSGGFDPISKVSGMSFTDVNNGWVAVNPQIGAHDIYKTSDGGVTWTKVTAPVGVLIGGLLFTDSSTGYAVGATGTLYKTTDGSQSWTPFVAGNPSMQGMVGLTLSAPDTIWTLGTVGRSIGYGGVFSSSLN